MTSHLRARRRAVALAGLLVLACSRPALGQTQLYLLTSGSDWFRLNPECQPWDYGEWCWIPVIPHPGRVIQLDFDRRQIVATPVTPALGTAFGPRTTPDGRFLLWSGLDVEPLFATYKVSLFDIAHRQQGTLFAGGWPYVPLTVHPSEMRAFLQLSQYGPVTVVEPGHTRTLPPPPCAFPWWQKRSGDGSRLSYFCGDPRSVMVVDSGDGRLLGTVALGAPSSSVSTAHVLDDSGTTMYAVDIDNALEDPVLYRRFDVATGALLAERKGAEVATSLWAYNQVTGHLYAGNSSGIVVLDANTLAEIGRIASPHPALWPNVAFDPEHPHAYIAWPKDGGGALRVSIIHTGTLATLDSIDIPIDGELVGMALGPRPPGVSDLGALVDGRMVTLSWTIDASRSIATEQVVEAGFAPGETAVRLPVAAGDTTLTVPGVPPGRYYVRVRSVNGTGIGAPRTR